MKYQCTNLLFLWFFFQNKTKQRFNRFNIERVSKRELIKIYTINNVNRWVWL